MRGLLFWKQTPHPARETFQRFQGLGMEMALAAYGAAPDFVPATDAVFKIVIRSTSGYWMNWCPRRRSIPAIFDPAADRDFDRDLIFLMRRIVVQPFHHHELGKCRRIPDAGPRAEHASLADPVFINVILHSGHATSAIINMLEEKLTTLDFYNRARDLPALLENPENPEEDIVLMSEDELVEEVLCPIARLGRLYAIKCEAENRCQ